MDFNRRLIKERTPTPEELAEEDHKYKIAYFYERVRVSETRVRGFTMKINIGKHVNWIGPYQIAEKLLFWKDKYSETDDTVHNFGIWLAENKNGKNSWLTNVCSWIHQKKQRKVKIRIDNYDTWSMDHTLAYIIVPMLKQLQATLHGAPFVDDKDVPAELRSTAAPKRKNKYDTDDNHFKRWDWAMNEMIWAFEQKISDSDFWFEMKTSDAKKLEARKQNGYRLFGKYYDALWD